MKNTISELRKLNQSVPNPLRLPTIEDVRREEENLGISFHSDFIEFQLEAGDVIYGYTEPVTLYEESGHTYVGLVANTACSVGVPKELFPICCDNSDYYCMNSEGQVIFWSHEGVSNDSWRNLEQWILDVWIEGN